MSRDITVDNAVEVRYYEYQGRKIKRTIIRVKCKKCNSKVILSKNASGLCRSCSRKRKPFISTWRRIGINSQWKNNLTFEEFLKFTAIKCCHYCDKFIKWEPHTSSNGVLKNRATNLDRKDSFAHYTNDNCVVCCDRCNRLKSNKLSYEEFLQIGAVLKGQDRQSNNSGPMMQEIDWLDERFWRY